MASFGNHSREQLATVSPVLQRLFEEVVKGFDCSILEGHRTRERQQALYAQGRTEPGYIVTKKDGIHRLSEHQLVDADGLALAVDVAPYPIAWGDRERFNYFAGYVRRVAEDLGLSVKWGGDWDGDTLLGDEKWRDLPHWQVR